MATRAERRAIADREACDDAERHYGDSVSDEEITAMARRADAAIIADDLANGRTPMLKPGNERTPMLPSAHYALYEQLDAIAAAHPIARSYVSWSPTAADYPAVLAVVVRWARANGAKMEDHIHDTPGAHGRVVHVETTRVTLACMSILTLHRPVELHVDGARR